MFRRFKVQFYAALKLAALPILHDLLQIVISLLEVQRDPIMIER